MPPEQRMEQRAGGVKKAEGQKLRSGVSADEAAGQQKQLKQREGGVTKVVGQKSRIVLPPKLEGRSNSAL